MAGWFTSDGEPCRLLDAGAGIGSLTSAFLARVASGELRYASVDVSTFERDTDLLVELQASLGRYVGDVSFRSVVHPEDFIEATVNSLQFAPDAPGYTHAILNPPYKKIASASRERHLLRLVGIETVNLYAAFVALALARLTQGGQLVAIVPRSFCNGPYYQPFRTWLLTHGALTHMHLFDSRSQAFKDDGVLQENLILRMVRGAAQGDVTVSTSTDDHFDDLTHQTFPFAQVVHAADARRLWHVPLPHAGEMTELPAIAQCTLEELGIQVSTGPVVDFRLRTHLRATAGPGTVPLIYPAHFSGGQIVWPLAEHKKSNAIVRDVESEKWLYPLGTYCLVRRLSSKEERRRIVAAVLEPHAVNHTPMLGFENHLNVFHSDKQGLPRELAYGLSTYLQSQAVDTYFRRFSGHTQVNASDLRHLRYPDRDALSALGTWVLAHPDASPQTQDAYLAAMPQ